jgi:hypothetical protein
MRLARAFAYFNPRRHPKEASMMHKPPLLLAGLALVAASSLLAFTSAANAHERRTVGQFNFVVGFLNEPALVEEPNAVDLRVSRAGDATPVTGLEQTLRVEVTHEGETLEVQLRPRFNVPGAYDGRFYPTSTGVYSFRFFGTIEGVEIDERFTSSDTTFSSIDASNAFANEHVTAQELQESITRLEQQMGKSPRNGGSGSAMTVAIIGVLIGAFGLVTAGYSLSRNSGRST